MLGRVAGAPDERQRSGQADRAGIRHDQHAQRCEQRPVDVWSVAEHGGNDKPEHPRQERDPKNGWYVDLQDASDEIKDSRLECPGVFHTADDLVEEGVLADSGDLDNQRPGAVHRSADDLVAFAFPLGYRLAGDQGLVHRRPPRRDPPIHRHPLAGADADAVAHLHGLERHLALLVIANQADRVRSQLQQLLDRTRVVCAQQQREPPREGPVGDHKHRDREEPARRVVRRPKYESDHAPDQPAQGRRSHDRCLTDEPTAPRLDRHPYQLRGQHERSDRERPERPPHPAADSVPHLEEHKWDSHRAQSEEGQGFPALDHKLRGPLRRAALRPPIPDREAEIAQSAEQVLGTELRAVVLDQRLLISGADCDVVDAGLPTEPPLDELRAQRAAHPAHLDPETPVALRSRYLVLPESRCP